MAGNRFENFKVIWCKESNRNSALYIDIKADGPNESPGTNDTIYQIGQLQIKLISKDNKKSTAYRNEGNQEFTKQNWCEAMRLYNKSLCFAEIGTENMAFAYANRSACFFNMKKYEEGLVDIELAMKANYPQRLMPKLEKRKDDCLNQIENGQHVSFEPQLSFEPSEKYPSMANNLEIKRDDTFGRYITAKEDIDVGKTVLIEKSYVSKAMDKEVRCNICLKSETNLVPCTRSTTDLFCNAVCENHYLHKFECGMKAHDDDIIDDGFMNDVRSILIAINTIPDVDNLMQFVEQTIARDRMNIPECEPHDELSKYRVFLELSFPQHTETYKLFNARINVIYKTLLKQPYVAAMFSSKRHTRFLKHLIAHHRAVIQYNCQSSYELGGNSRTTNLQPLMASYFNHSCAPNIATLSFDGFQIAVVIRPIKKGEQLFISYLGLDAWSLCLHQSRESRQKYIWKVYGFQCSCNRCTRTLQSAENSYDECYDYVIRNYHQKLKTVFDQETTKFILLEKCREFMKKYGRREWTDEMSLQMLCYVHMLSVTYKIISNV